MSEKVQGMRLWEGGSFIKWRAYLGQRLSRETPPPSHRETPRGGTSCRRPRHDLPEVPRLHSASQSTPALVERPPLAIDGIRQSRDMGRYQTGEHQTIFPEPVC